jgi:hypothetical protein
MATKKKRDKDLVDYANLIANQPECPGPAPEAPVFSSQNFYSWERVNLAAPIANAGGETSLTQLISALPAGMSADDMLISARPYNGLSIVGRKRIISPIYAREKKAFLARLRDFEEELQDHEMLCDEYNSWLRSLFAKQGFIRSCVEKYSFNEIYSVKRIAGVDRCFEFAAICKNLLNINTTSIHESINPYEDNLDSNYDDYDSHIREHINMYSTSILP